MRAVAPKPLALRGKSGGRPEDRQDDDPSGFIHLIPEKIP